MRLVVDASVAVKWVLRTAENEPHIDQALGLLDAAVRNAIEIVQPPHWLIEVAAVITRVRPEGAADAISFMAALGFRTAFDAEILKRASRIAVQARQHLFDTLYHAVALEREAVLVTADDRYVRSATRFGSLVPLPQWRPPIAADE